MTTKSAATGEGSERADTDGGEERSFWREGGREGCNQSCVWLETATAAKGLSKCWKGGWRGRGFCHCTALSDSHSMPTCLAFRPCMYVRVWPCCKSQHVHPLCGDVIAIRNSAVIAEIIPSFIHSSLHSCGVVASRVTSDAEYRRKWGRRRSRPQHVYLEQMGSSSLLPPSLPPSIQTPTRCPFTTTSSLHAGLHYRNFCNF